MRPKWRRAAGLVHGSAAGSSTSVSAGNQTEKEIARMTVAIAERGDHPMSALLPPSAKSISVIVTALNEEGNLEPTVDSVVRAVSPRFADYEVIVIDDGSTDRTFEIAESLAAENPKIRVHHNPRNLGLG